MQKYYRITYCNFMKKRKLDIAVYREKIYYKIILRYYIYIYIYIYI